MDSTRATTTGAPAPVTLRRRILNALVSIARAIDAGPPRALTVPAIALVVALLAYQLRSVFTPIIGEHNWRQSDTYSVAYNFVHESADFFHPRIDLTKGRSGIMGMECPIYPFLVSVVMRIFGDSPACARAVSWLFLVAALAAGARYLRPKDRPSIGLGFVVMMAMSPAVLFEFRQIQPDPAMTSACVIAACLLHEYGKTERRWKLVAGVAVYTAAVLMKTPALALGPAMWLFTLTGKKPSLASVARRAAAFLVPIAAALAWYAWAKHLTRVYNGGEAYFGIDFLSSDDLKSDITNEVQLTHIFSHLMSIWLPNWTTYPAVLAGVVLAFQKEHRPLTWPMLAWLAGGSLVLAMFSRRLLEHWYYALFVVPVFAYAGGVAIGRLLDLVGRPDDMKRYLTRAAGSFVILAFTATLLVEGPPRTLAEVPMARAFVPDATWVSSRGTVVLLVCAAVALAVAALPLRFHARPVYGTLAVVAACAALSRGVHDETEAFKHWTRMSEWAEFDRDWGPLRKAADMYSTRKDVFLVDGGTPWYLHRVFRKGFAEHPEGIDARGLDVFTARGARFFVHYPEVGDEPRVVVLPRKHVLARAEKWVLVCIDPNGCPPVAR